MLLKKLAIAAAILVSVASSSFGAQIIPNQDLKYLGAFRVPHDGGASPGMWWGYARDGLTFNPNGNGGQGSLFGVGPDNNAYSYVSEISIPAPVASKNVNDLPFATYLQQGAFGEISGGLVGIQSPEVRQKVYGLAYLPKQGTQTTDKLYWASIYNYQPDNAGLDATTLGYSELNLTAPQSKGKWTLKNGSAGANIPSAYTTKWMLTIPKAWADTYLGGQYLGVGRDAVGQTGQNAGYGASLYTFAPATSDTPPASGTALPATELLRFPSTNPMERNHGVSDWAGGASWVTVGSKAALIFSYTKAMRSAPAQAPNLGLGDYPWEDYKYPSCLGGGHFCWPETIASTYQLAPPDVFGAPYIAQLKFFDPSDLALVAQGKKNPWDVHPYANYQIEKYVFRPQGATSATPGWTEAVMGGMTYDSTNQKIYVEEINADAPYPIIHVFQVQNTAASTIGTANPSIPTNINNSGAVISWGASVDSNGSSTDMVYVIHKWYAAYTSPDVNHASYPAMWRPIASTTALTWTDPANQTGDRYNVTAYDAMMQPSNLLNLSYQSDATPPTVSIASPTSGATVSGVVAASATASDNVGVTKVEFYVNGVLQANDTTGPFNFTWDTTLLSNGSYTITAKAYDAAGNVGLSAPVSVTVSNVAPDLTAPTVSITAPSNGSNVSGSVPVTFNASDNVAVSSVQFYVNGSLVGAYNAAPYNSLWDTTRYANGNYTFTAKAFDAAGNVGQSSAVTVTINNVVPDTTAPVIGVFTMPTTSNASTLAVSSLSATDKVGVTGYMITESSSAPAASASGWTATAPTNFTFAGTGARTAYAWAKDAAGNVSAARSASVTITSPDTTAPSVSAFSIPATAATLTVSISSFSATDNVGVTGYLVTENATAPTAAAAGWGQTIPTSFTFASAGTRTAHAWAKDAAGNVSVARSASVIITLPDTTAPIVSAFSIPATANTLAIPISSFSATDNVGVTGYLVTESATAPTAAAAGWGQTIPTSFAFAGTGTRTAYAWAKDAANNVSASRAVSVLIDTTLPAIKSMSLVRGSSNITVKASASDNIAVTKMLLYVDNSLQMQTSASSFSYVWTVTYRGYHTIKVNAYDAAGNVRSQSLKIYK